MHYGSRISRLLIPVAIAIAIVGCTKSPADSPRLAPSAASPGQTAVLLCQPGFRLCTSCRGTPICSIQCPVCPPPANEAEPGTTTAPEPAADTAELTCRFPQRSCIGCNGQQLCALHCPECAPPAAPTAPPTPTTVATTTCHPPLHRCPGCNGGADYCGSVCLNCPVLGALAADPAPETLALVPSVDSCGGTICSPGTFCCNPSCGICTPKGVNCTQQSCN